MRNGDCVTPLVRAVYKTKLLLYGSFVMQTASAVVHLEGQVAVGVGREAVLLPAVTDQLMEWTDSSSNMEWGSRHSCKF